MRTDQAVTVTAAEFDRNVGVYQDVALTRPVAITKDGRRRTVLVSAEEYRRLKRRDREVLGLGDLTDADIAAIAAASVDPKHDHLNEELKDWEPSHFPRPSPASLSVIRIFGALNIFEVEKRESRTGHAPSS